MRDLLLTSLFQKTAPDNLFKCCFLSQVLEGGREEEVRLTQGVRELRTGVGQAACMNHQAGGGGDVCHQGLAS